MKFREAVEEAKDCCVKFPECDECQENCALREVAEKELKQK